MHLIFHFARFIARVERLHALIKFSTSSESGFNHSPVLFFFPLLKGRLCVFFIVKYCALWSNVHSR